MDDSERTLRELWDANNVPKDEQDKILAEIDLMAQPGAKIGPWRLCYETEEQKIKSLIEELERSIVLLEAVRRGERPPPSILVSVIDSCWSAIKTEVIKTAVKKSEEEVNNESGKASQV